MTTPTLNPAGWYTDPTGRHEARFWDSEHWTAQVADHGVTSVEGLHSPADQQTAVQRTPDAPPVFAPSQAPEQAFPPPPAVLPSAAAAPAPAGSGYRVAVAPPWRVLLVRIGVTALTVAFFFEAVASLALGSIVNDATYGINPPSESSFRWAAWLYHYTSVPLTYSYPPVLLWPTLFFGFVFAGSLVLSRSMALSKAGCRGRWAWSANAQRKRLGDGLHAMGYAKFMLRAGGGRRARVIVTEIAALIALAVSWYAVARREAVFQDVTELRFTGELTLGYGPTLCLIATVLAVVTVPLAWPWRNERHVIVYSDGSVEDPEYAARLHAFDSLLSSAPAREAFAAPVGQHAAEPPPAPPPSAFALTRPPATDAPKRTNGRSVLLSIAAVLALVAGLLLWAPWSGSGPGVATPGAIVAENSAADSISFRWTAPAGEVPDSYVIRRDGKDLATVPGTVTSYKDTAVAPASAYSYAVVAVQGDRRSAPTAVQRIYTRTPAIAAARLAGTFRTTTTVTKSGGGNVTVGTKMSDTWLFKPTCASGPCTAVLSGALGGGEFTPHSFTMTLKHSGGVYTGTTRAHITHCSTTNVRDTLTVRVRVTKAAVVDGKWTATTVVGSLVEDSPYTTSGPTTYCPAQTNTMSIRAAR